MYIYLAVRARPFESAVRDDDASREDRFNKNAPSFRP